MAKNPAPGDPAPDFALEGTDGTFRLSDHRGERVVLLFYPGDQTLVCTKQFCSYRDNADAFGALGVTAVGISGKGVDSKQAFADKHGFTVPLLADPDGAVSMLYDAYTKPLKMTKRSVVIIDEKGIVRHRHDHALGLSYQSVDDIRKALETIPG